MSFKRQKKLEILERDTSGVFPSEKHRLCSHAAIRDLLETRLAAFRKLPPQSIPSLFHDSK